MSEPIKKKILRHVTHRAYQPQQFAELADDLGVDKSDRESLQNAVDELIEDDQVVLGSGDAISLPPPGREMTGRFKRHERGFGFILPDTPNVHGDLFVPAENTGGALTGDMVRAQVIRRGRRGPAGRSPFIGRIVEITQRADSHFVGTLHKQGKLFVVVVDGKALTQPVVVRDPGAKHAKVGDKVVVDLTRYPDDDYLPEGVITEVLGRTGDADVELTAICRAYDLADEFPQVVTDEARAVVNRYNKKPESFNAGRVDMRDEFVLTIDPPDAQDFDDALSIRKTKQGLELGVHIADVAAFVQPDSAIDKEAYERGNSTYLPRKVIPMLPEVLSNGLCSLQPGVPRLARSAFITYDDEGNVVGSRFARTIIDSNHRLTYIEAQALIDGDKKLAREHAKNDAPYTNELIDTLKQMDALSKTIRKRRFRDGMITLDLPEVELIYGEDGHVVDAQPEDDAYTHKLIEAFMVEANEAVARVFADLNVPLIRRLHPDPSAHDTTELRMFARVAGFNIPENPDRKQLQELLEKTRGTPAAKAVHFAVLRTLTKAEYAPDLIGHFALASEHYTHFTSPIRRYPDLTVHRAFDALMEELGDVDRIPKQPAKRKRLGARLRSDPRCLDEDKLREVGSHCSSTERNSEAAERELRTLLLLHLMEEHIGEDFDGTVAGVTNFGVFCQIDKYLVEGMIRTDALPGAPAERWKLNPYTGSLTAQRSGRSITIGDTFKVRINKVDLVRREMDLLIVDNKLGKPAGPAKCQRKKGQPPKDKSGTKSKRKKSRKRRR